VKDSVLVLIRITIQSLKVLGGGGAEKCKCQKSVTYFLNGFKKCSFFYNVIFTQSPGRYFVRFDCSMLTSWTNSTKGFRNMLTQRFSTQTMTNCEAPTSLLLQLFNFTDISRQLNKIIFGLLTYGV